MVTRLGVQRLRDVFPFLMRRAAHKAILLTGQLSRWDRILASGIDSRRLVYCNRCDFGTGIRAPSPGPARTYRQLA